MYNFRIKDEPFARGYVGAGSDSIYISTGSGYKEAAKAVRIYFDSETGFPSLDFGYMACSSSFDGGQTANFGILEEKAAQTPEFAEDYRYIAEYMKKADLGQRIWSAFTPEEVDVTVSGSGWGGTWGGHAVPDLIDFARIGTDKMREKIAFFKKKNPEKDDFYEGLIMTLDAIDEIGAKILFAAKEEYSKTENHKLKKVISAFEKGPRKPCETFEEAVCVYVTLFMLDGIDSPGHFDQYMIDFWERSDHDSSREALEDIWLFFHKTRTWNLCISGSDENGNDLTNALSYEILEVARKYRFQTPNLTMRCHKNTPERLWESAYETISLGMGLPVLYNDEVVCPALESLGIPKEDSHRYVMNGCNQIDIQGKSHMGLEDGEVNLGLALSYAVFGGYNIMQEKYIGAKTPPDEELDTFEKFYDALKSQLILLMDSVCSMANKAQRIRAEYSSNPIRSLTVEGCIEKGLDYKNRGPLYGHGQILFEGVPDCIDSVANIKRFVYDEKKYTLSDVREAMAHDYEGYEEMCKAFRSSGLNFGNDISETDSLGAEIIDFCNSYLRTKETFRGGVYGGGCSPFDRAASNGYAAGPLPNGKRRGEHMYGDSIGATPGKNLNGPTALLNSCLSFDHKLAASGFILNLKFDKALFSCEKGKESFLAIAKVYFEGGGQQLSVTVVNKEDLIDALSHPEDHEDLIVRVGGFSAYFTQLTRPLQENIIARTSF